MGLSVVVRFRAFAPGKVIAALYNAGVSLRSIN